ncbi:LysR family transcriptional regulator [Rhodomicrobium vannielii]|uniref:LysR family transcriptional regulator n=1 Tax=Rhodomicrobium vannielii TaxID=1069 RepID=UPI0031BA8300
MKKLSFDTSDISTVELRQFRQFVAVAEELHFRRAAARLGMAQPPLSQAIRKLERDIGVDLFDRSARQVRLTDAGAAFLEEARRAIVQADRAVRAAQRAARGLRGTLRVTYVGSAVYDVLPRLIRTWRDRHGDVELVLRERTTTAQIRALAQGEADVGFVRSPLFGAAGLNHRTIKREPLIAALPAGHRLADRAFIALADLAGEPFVTFPSHEGPSLHARIVAACERAGFSPEIAQEAVQMHTIVALVAAGLGVALVPASMRSLRQEGVAYRDIADAPDSLTVELAVLWRRGEPSSVVTAFLDTVREAK